VAYSLAEQHSACCSPGNRAAAAAEHYAPEQTGWDCPVVRDALDRSAVVLVSVVMHSHSAPALHQVGRLAQVLRFEMVDYQAVPGRRAADSGAARSSSERARHQVSRPGREHCWTERAGCCESVALRARPWRAIALRSGCPRDVQVFSPAALAWLQKVRAWGGALSWRIPAVRFQHEQELGRVLPPRHRARWCGQEPPEPPSRLWCFGPHSPARQRQLDRPLVSSPSPASGRLLPHP
jgi:hypothetical protein